MIVSFFRTRGGVRGAGNSIDYLLGKDRAREGARLLQGDPDLSVAIADTSGFSNRYTVGCLSFEEENMPEAQKRQIMQSFEETLLAGLEPDQYNITWVEHLDKGRLELNFFIPNVELRTGKRLQPYYDRVDRGLVDNWKQVINHEHGLTRPDDPTKKQVVKLSKDLPKMAKEAQETITRAIESLVIAGEVKDRQGVLEALEGAGLEVARQTKTSISIKNPDGGRNIRLTGAFYEQNFRAGGDLRATIEGASREYQQNLETDYRKAQAKLSQYVRARAERFTTLYQRPEQALDKPLQRANARLDEPVQNDDQRTLDLPSDSGRGVTSLFGGDIVHVDPNKQSEYVERASGQVRTPESPERLGDTGGERRNIPSPQREEQPSVQSSERLQRFENDKVEEQSYGNRFTTSLQRAITRLSEGFERIGETIERVRNAIKKTARNERGFTRRKPDIERGKQAIGQSKHAINRAKQGLEGANRTLAYHKRKINESLSEPDRDQVVASTAQAQFKQAYEERKKQTVKSRELRRDDDRGLSL